MALYFSNEISLAVLISTRSRLAPMRMAPYLYLHTPLDSPTQLGNLRMAGVQEGEVQLSDYSTFKSFSNLW